MSYENNPLIKECLKLGSVRYALTPEKIIFGYARAITLSKDDQKRHFSQASIRELKRVEKVMKQIRLNIRLIAAAVPWVLVDFTNSVLYSERKEAYIKFEKQLQNEEGRLKPEELIENALKTSVVPFKVLFSVENDIEDISNLIRYIKNQPKTVIKDFDESIRDHIEEYIDNLSISAEKKLSKELRTINTRCLLGAILLYLLDFRACFKDEEWTWDTVLEILRASRIKNYVDPEKTPIDRLFEVVKKQDRESCSSGLYEKARKEDPFAFNEIVESCISIVSIAKEH